MAQTDAFRSRIALPVRRASFTNVLQMVGDIVPEAISVCPFKKSLILLYVCLALWLGWLLLPLPELDNNGSLTSAVERAGLHNYFSNFEGFSECNIRAAALYAPPPKDPLGFHAFGTFCHDQKHLLEALSGGGRVGFDAPYMPRGTPGAMAR